MLEKTISSKDGFNIISNKEMHKIAKHKEVIMQKIK